MTALPSALTLRLGASNVYLLPSRHGFVAIDAGPDYEGAWESALAQMTAAAIDPRDVRLVLVTHGHPDHCALATRWQSEVGAAVWVAGADAGKLRAGGRDPGVLRDRALDFLQNSGVPPEMVASARTTPSPQIRGRPGANANAIEVQRRLLNLRSIAPEHGEWPGPLRPTAAEPVRLIEDGETIEFGDLQLLAIVCPGHTPASTVFLNRETREIYTGDHVLERIAPTPGIHFDVAGNRLRSLPQYLRSLQSVLPIAPSRVLPGHGDPFTDLGGAVQRTTALFEQRANRVLRRLREAPASGYALALQLFPHLRPAATWVVMAEIIGLLDLLEERGQVSRTPGEPIEFKAVV